MVIAYSKMEQVIALNVETVKPHLVEVSAFRMSSICFSNDDVYCICCENISFGSKVIPRIFKCFVVGSVWLFNLSDRVIIINPQIKICFISM